MKMIGRLNQILNEVEYRLGRTRLMSGPIDVDVVLTKACNFACTFCKDYETPNGSKRISVSNFEKLARQVFPTASRMNICSGGEPYLHTGLEDILRIGKKYSLYTWLLSNGSVHRRDRVETIVKEGLVDEHGFSVDGINAKTVEGIRINGKFDQIMSSVNQLLELREHYGRGIPRLTIRYALLRSNIEELPAAVEFWGRKGASRLVCGYVSLANNMDHDLSLYYHQDLAHRIMNEAKEVAKKFPRLALELPRPIGKSSSDSEALTDCRSPWRFIMVDTNGEILPCYRAFEALRFGKIYDDDGIPFRQVWNSANYQALRRTVNNDEKEKFYPYCKVCENRCGWNEEGAHLGDENWQQVLGEKWLPKGMRHQRPPKGTAAKELARAKNDS